MFLWFLGGFLTAVLLIVLLLTVFCLGLAAGEKKLKTDSSDTELYSEVEVK